MEQMWLQAERMEALDAERFLTMQHAMPTLTEAAA